MTTRACWALVLLSGCSPRPVDIAALEAELRQKYGDRTHTVTIVESDQVCGGTGDACPDYDLFEKAGWLAQKHEADRRVQISVTPEGRRRCRLDVESGRNYYRFDLSHWELVGIDSPKPGSVIPRDVRTLEVEYRTRYVLLPNGVALKAFGWKPNEGPSTTTTTFVRSDGSDWHIKPYREGGSHPAF